MMNARQLSISDFSYNLPEERIAKFPVTPRDHSKLLVYKGGQTADDYFYNLADHLPQGELMVFNNTKVIHARMLFHKATGALIEIFLLEPYEPADYEQMFHTTGHCSWLCMVGNLKKWKEGPLVRTVNVQGSTFTVTATRRGMVGTSHIVEFQWCHGSTRFDTVDLNETREKPCQTEAPFVLNETREKPCQTEAPFVLNETREKPCQTEASFADILDVAGQLPIPPYLNRETQQSDLTTYQTVYSKIKGSVAAPTAGLHFTPQVLASLDARGIDREELTLHVGAGTFKPVKSKEMGGHEMHSEHVCVRRQTLQKLLDHQCQAIAVGTTSVRTLESLYYMGLKVQADDTLTEEQLHVGQWEPYDLPAAWQHPSRQQVCQAVQALLSWLDRRQMEAFHASTQIIIAPGYQFKIVSRLITNFHQPQSTLLLLVSAFTQNHWREIYDHALSHDYRFLSYGDSSLLEPPNS